MGIDYKTIVDQDFQFPKEKHQGLLTYLKTTFADGGKDFENVKIALESFFEDNPDTKVLQKDGTLHVELYWDEEFEDEHHGRIWALSPFMKDHSYIEYHREGYYFRMYVHEGNVYTQDGEIVYPAMKGQK